MNRVIDVSKWNGTITEAEWKKIKADGVTGAILKIISIDRKPDAQFYNNVKMCTKLGIYWEVYNYTYATSNEVGRNDMNIICNILDKCDKKYFKGHIWWDLEDDAQTHLGKNRLADLMNYVQAIVEMRGYKFGVYSGDYYLRSYVNLNRVHNKDWWLARYYLGYVKMDKNSTVNEKYKPTSVSPLLGWQYTSTYYINGKKYDMSELYKPLGATYNSSPSAITSVDKVKVEVPTFKVGSVYETQVELCVRKGPGVTYAPVGRDKLTSDAKKHDLDRDGAIDKGTKVTCKEVKNVAGDIWIRTPSGWCAAFYKGHTYIK